MNTTQITTLATETVRLADSEAMLTRATVYGEGEGGCYEIRVSRESARRFRVCWAFLRPSKITLDAVHGVVGGSGWRSWGCIKATEAEAIAFANEKLPVLRKHAYQAKAEA